MSRFATNRSDFADQARLDDQYPQALKPSDHGRTLSPCPFSRGYRISLSLAWRSLGVFWAYRLILGSLFISPHFFQVAPSFLGKHDPQLVAVACIGYFSLIVLSGVALAIRHPGYSVQAQIQVFTDILAIPVIMHASGGIESGIGVLLALSVAAGGLLIGGRCALLFAALASLAILGEQVYADLSDAFAATAYMYSGMLGAAYFTIALLALVLARRAEQSEAVAAQRSVDIANLQQLNEHVIKHLHSGILVVDEERLIRTSNRSALQLLGSRELRGQLQSAQPELDRHYGAWLANASSNAVSMKTAAGGRLEARFTRLDDTQPRLCMILLEDGSLHDRRVQQSKLASLGRLTASIAHEIRNPLGAIHHASQLLAESDALRLQDLRLTEIILTHTARVNSIIENILQISRPAPSQRRNIALYPWLVKFARDFEAEYQVYDSPFDLGPSGEEVWIFMDPGHLKQILENLCVNALKHGKREHGKILLRAGRQGEDGAPCLEVIDDGPGIRAEYVTQIFEPFFTTSASGTGLGLYIARELAELNQARLDYEVVPGGGSCFRLTLPDVAKAVIEL
jgi:two-component system sensor histidine kinase PilS (NtrC family)